MTTSPFDDPNLQAYLEHAERELLPMMEQSRIAITLITGAVDPKICLEMGAAVLLDKPIIAVILKGAAVPANLKRVASVIIEGDIMDAALQAKIQKAIANVMEQDRRTQ